MPAVPKQEEPIFRYVRNSLKGWRATVEKTQDKKWAKYVPECDDLLLPSDVHNLLSSPPAVKGLKAITAARDGSTLSSSQFFAARDLILASLCLQNGLRPSPMNNANLADYEGARREETSGKLVMLIAKHKRTQQGPAMLCMGNNLQWWLRTYVDHIRPNFAQPQEDALFVTSSGEAFPEATIGKRITAFYKKAGIRTDIRVSSTKIRKMISSEVHSNEPDVAGALRKLMAHSRKTAETSYVQSSLTTTAASAHAIVHRNINPKSPAKIEKKVKEVYPQSPTGSVSSICSWALNMEEKNTIDLLFSEETSSNTAITLPCIRRRMTESLTLQPLTTNPKMVKRVLDRVRYLQPKAPWELWRKSSCPR